MEVPHVDRSFGRGPIGRETAEEWLVRRFQNEGGSKIEGFEIEKSARDLEIIRFVDDAASALLKRYGRTKDIRLPPGNIHFLEEGGVEQYTEGRFSGGAHAAVCGSVILDRSPSDIQTACTLFHELLHAKSYQAMQVTPERAVESARRGFTVISRDAKKTYFVDLEEAVISVLTRRFYEDRLLQSPLFREELKRLHEADELERYREEETKMLNDLVDELWQRNRAVFASRDEIVDLFIGAQFNGRLLPVARLIERAFGSGSFRALGERTGEKLDG